ncbi:hypothetical protein CCYA_CCYA01G0338 [Cyanidiococcus yangmingshanensis]|nr:hypothetical protein CCYA_CCYA01G0338 [Cyanidiococcus yangmingshanensis]
MGLFRIGKKKKASSEAVREGLSASVSKRSGRSELVSGSSTSVGQSIKNAVPGSAGAVHGSSRLAHRGRGADQGSLASARPEQGVGRHESAPMNGRQIDRSAQNDGVKRLSGSNAARRRSLMPRQVPSAVRTAAENGGGAASAAGHRRTDSASSSGYTSAGSWNAVTGKWTGPEVDAQLLKVARLAARDDDARRKLVQRDVLPVLASAMVDQRTSAIGKSHAAFALAELSVLDEHEEALARAQTPSALVECLRSTILEVASATRSTHTKLDLSPGSALCVSLTILVSVTRALRNLTAGTPRTVEGIVRAGAIPELVQVLCAPEALTSQAIMQDALVEAAGAIGNIAQEPPCTIPLVKAKCVKAILRHLDRFEKPAERAEFAFHAASIMAELSLQSGAVHDHLIDAGAFPALARLIESESTSDRLWREIGPSPPSTGTAFRASDTVAEACRALGNLCATARGRSAARGWPLVIQALCRFIEQCEQRQVVHSFDSSDTNPLADACRALANLCIEVETARSAADLAIDRPLLSILELSTPGDELCTESRRALMVLAHADDDVRREVLTHLRQCSERSVKSGRSDAVLMELRAALVRNGSNHACAGGEKASAAKADAAASLAPRSLKSRPVRAVAGSFQSSGRTVTMRPLAGMSTDHFYTVDTFELGQVLGRGGYGVVYMARNVRTNEIVAIKSFHAVDSGHTLCTVDPRAFKEQRLWKRLRHENIVEYKGSFIGEKGDLNLVIEYVDGWSLAEHLAQFNEFHEPLVREITRQVLHGLAYLHTHGVTHRDLKPGNIMVNQNGVVKITDFGVSSCVDLQTAGSGHTMVGTPWYIAPEMIEGRPYDHSVDIWSLGCTVLELATGRRPYHALNGMAALFRMVQDKMPPIPSDLSSECASFLRACWVWEPNQRPNAVDLLKHQFVRLDRAVSGTARV